MESRDRELCWVTVEELLRSPPFPPRREDRPPEELVSSVRILGVLSPALVRPTDGGLQLVCGLRRLHAARAAGLVRVPCLVSLLDDVQAIRCFLSENGCRRSRDDRELEESLALMKSLRDASDGGSATVPSPLQGAENGLPHASSHPSRESEGSTGFSGVDRLDVSAKLASSRRLLDDVHELLPRRREVEDVVERTRVFFDEVRRLRRVDVSTAMAIVDDLIATGSDTRVLRPQDVYRGDHSRWLAPHSVLSASFSLALAPSGCSRAQRRVYGLAGLLHDIGMAFFEGKDYVSSPRVLTVDQRAELRRHVWLGDALLSDLEPDLAGVADAARDHHERADGSGYPRGLRGDEISVLTRVTTIADVYAALVGPRPHRSCRPAADALEEAAKVETISGCDSVLASRLGRLLDQGAAAAAVTPTALEDTRSAHAT